MFNQNILDKRKLWSEEMALNEQNNLNVENIEENNINIVNTIIDHDDSKSAELNEANELQAFKFNESEQKDDDIGFAMLKGNDWCHYLKKLFCIIGRDPLKYGNSKSENNINKANTSTSWEVDVDLGSNVRISKQHALIIYNFQTGVFEIKNLSKKYSIKVNGETIKWNEEMPLSSKSSIIIGNQEFFFLLAI